MLYSMLGRAVWFTGKRYLRHRYGRLHVPKPVLAGSALALAGAGAAVAVNQRNS
jgi:hypothetical protein